MRIIAVDPGETSGFAVLEDGQLVHNQRASSDMSDDLASAWPADVFVVERPQVYPGARSGQANDLITLAIDVGAWLCSWARWRSCRRHTALPRDWKGQISKDVCHDRLVSRLTSTELAKLSPDVDARDAVGIAKWAWRRVEIGQLPGKKYGK